MHPNDIVVVKLPCDGRFDQKRGLLVLLTTVADVVAHLRRLDGDRHGRADATHVCRPDAGAHLPELTLAKHVVEEDVAAPQLPRHVEVAERRRVGRVVTRVLGHPRRSVCRHRAVAAAGWSTKVQPHAASSLRLTLQPRNNLAKVARSELTASSLCAAPRHNGDSQQQQHAQRGCRHRSITVIARPAANLHLDKLRRGWRRGCGRAGGVEGLLAPVRDGRSVGRAVTPHVLLKIHADKGVRPIPPEGALLVRGAVAQEKDGEDSAAVPRIAQKDGAGRPDVWVRLPPDRVENALDLERKSARPIYGAGIDAVDNGARCDHYRVPHVVGVKRQQVPLKRRRGCGEDCSIQVVKVHQRVQHAGPLGLRLGPCVPHDIGLGRVIMEDGEDPHRAVQQVLERTVHRVSLHRHHRSRQQHHVTRTDDSGAVGRGERSEDICLAHHQEVHLNVGGVENSTHQVGGVGHREAARCSQDVNAGREFDGRHHVQALLPANPCDAVERGAARFICGVQHANAAPPKMRCSPNQAIDLEAMRGHHASEIRVQRLVGELVTLSIVRHDGLGVEFGNRGGIGGKGGASANEDDVEVVRPHPVRRLRDVGHVARRGSLHDPHCADPSLRRLALLEKDCGLHPGRSVPEVPLWVAVDLTDGAQKGHGFVDRKPALARRQPSHPHGHRRMRDPRQQRHWRHQGDCVPSGGSPW
mmetsp:Transcript_9335/g.28259  ORF Transcript_9335/g.28259 Transcript_9335/m.28259 type:complete len:697 (-) Transcript_9335:186-2276(-)